MIVVRPTRLLLAVGLVLMALSAWGSRLRGVEAATLTVAVTSTADTHDATPGNGICADSAGQCTLRAAVEEANAQPGDSVITVTVPAGAYNLVLGALTLNNTIAISGAGLSRTFLVDAGQPNKERFLTHDTPSHR